MTVPFGCDHTSSRLGGVCSAAVALRGAKLSSQGSVKRQRACTAQDGSS
jgi:hypothetical protein